MGNYTGPLKNASLSERTRDFLDRAHLINGDRYGYENVVYLNNRTAVSIICPIHGLFSQKSRNHLRGYGCRKCANQLQTTTDFIRKAEFRHGNFYSYDLTVYETTRKMVTIRCPLHGPFEQKAGAHLHGAGCAECARAKSREAHLHDLKWFLERARKAHGTKFSYESVIYTGIDTKVTIGCPIHGPVEQTPYCHITSQFGCSLCALSLGRYNRFTFGTCGASAETLGTLYLLELTSDVDRFLKVGITTKPLANRTKVWKRTHKIKPILSIGGHLRSLYLFEQNLMITFGRYRYVPKRLTDGCTECFRPKALLDLCEYIDDFVTGEYTV
jgi:hypothetical protein